MDLFRRTFVSVSLVALSYVASADLRDLSIGGGVGVYFPQSGAVRTAFGGSEIKIGLSPIGHQPGEDWKLVPSIGLVRASDKGNHFNIVPVNLNLERAYGSKGALIRPYVRAGAGIAYYDYGVTVGVTRHSGKTFGSCAQVEAGVLITPKAKAYARYDAFSRKGGLNFSGVELGFEYVLFKL